MTSYRHQTTTIAGVSTAGAIHCFVYEGLRPKLLKALSITQERSSGSEESAALLHICRSTAEKTSDSKGADLCRPRIVPRSPHQLSRTWCNLTSIGYNPQLLIEDVLLLQHGERREGQWCKYVVRMVFSSYCYTQDDAEYDVDVCYDDRGSCISTERPDGTSL